ncbi:helix-turn-helix domain-containing protein [Curtobacterium sp. MCPF17_052]|uniref:helix-turn-helix domain-containing protein n=1 Tax=Curtobacterium sp. MCPF17_052 TaxID=2175655 RepID=UPI003464B309
MRVRRAVEFIHEHAGEPLSVADIARAADLSVRGLQESFQRILDRTPMTYLREVRLRHVHADLLHADPIATSVADVASRWGVRAHGQVLQRVPPAIRRVPAGDPPPLTEMLLADEQAR